MNPITDYIQATEDLLDFAVEELEKYKDWNVSKHPGSGTKDILKMVPEAMLPAAILVYSSSSYANKPRRHASFSVVVATEFEGDSGRIGARALIDKAISLLDGKISDMALFRAVSDHALELGSNIAAYEIQFKVEDH